VRNYQGELSRTGGGNMRLHFVWIIKPGIRGKKSAFKLIFGVQKRWGERLKKCDPGENVGGCPDLGRVGDNKGNICPAKI